MKVLIVGLGIGRVYMDQCKMRGFEVFTFDIDAAKHPTYSSVEQAQIRRYDLIIIATPNFTHEAYIRELADSAPFILVEKPGLKDRYAWQALCQEIAPTKLVMVKNNLYRPLQEITRKFPAQRIDIMWLNKNRIPNPGSWFTDKAK